MVYFQTKKIHHSQDFGYDHFSLSSANVSLQWYIIQCIRIVKMNTLRIGKILTVAVS